MDCDRAASALKTIMQHYGENVIWDSQRVKSLFRDYAPDLTEEDRLLGMVFDRNIHRIFMNIPMDARQQRNQLDAFKGRLMNNLYLKDTEADCLVRIFAAAFGIEGALSVNRYDGMHTGNAGGCVPPVHTEKKSKSVVLAAIFALIGVCTAIAAVVIIYFGNPADKPAPESTEEIIVSEEPTKAPDSERPTKQPTPKPYVTAEPEDEYIIDYDFRFSSNQIVSAEPGYSRTYNTAYSYYCDIPDNFTCEDYTDERRSYRADNNSAIVLLSADVNNGKSLNTVKNEYISKIGGTVAMDLHGDDWFAVSISKDGIDYYIKCYVDNYIRSYEMFYPNEYYYDYDDYVEYIEDNFRRTDR